MRHICNSITKISTISTIILIFQLISNANADTYYIATTGDDTHSGSISAPWLTVMHAWNNSGGGDTVLIRGGIYSETEIWLQLL